MEESVYSILARIFSFLSAFIFMMGLRFFWLNRGKKDEFAETGLPFVFRGFYHEIKLLKEAAGKGMASLFQEKSKAIAKDIKLAAMPLDPAEVFSAQLLWGLLFAAGGIIFMMVLGMDFSYIAAAILIMGFIGWLIPVVQIQNMAETRLNSIRRDLPFSIDLISSAMTAGLDFSAAVRYYVEHSAPTPLTQEFGVTLKMLELGNNRNDALRAMSDRLGIDEFRSLVNAVVQGTEMGASIVDTLRINAEEMRRVRIAAAERKAQRAPSLMMIPMALFIMPSVFIIILVPIFLRVQASGMNGLF